MPFKRSRAHCTRPPHSSGCRVRRVIYPDLFAAVRNREGAPTSILCLGIGALRDAAAQMQLAMLLELRSALEVGRRSDPVPSAVRVPGRGVRPPV